MTSLKKAQTMEKMYSYIMQELVVHADEQETNYIYPDYIDQLIKTLLPVD